jgi:hypothetical protein
VDANKIALRVAFVSSRKVYDSVRGVAHYVNGTAELIKQGDLETANKRLSAAIRMLADARSDLYVSQPRLAFQSSLGEAISVVEREVGAVESLHAEAKHPRDEKTLDKIRAKLKAVLGDLQYCESTLSKIVTASSGNPLLRQVLALARKGLSADEIARKLEREDAEVVGDAIAEAQRAGKIKKACLHARELRWVRSVLAAGPKGTVSFNGFSFALRWQSGWPMGYSIGGGARLDDELAIKTSEMKKDATDFPEYAVSPMGYVCAGSAGLVGEIHIGLRNRRVEPEEIDRFLQAMKSKGYRIK